MAKLCRDGDRVILRAEQKEWAKNRLEHCNLISASPGNTPSFVNGASCMVLRAYQRIEQLAFFDRYAAPICRRASIQERSSVTGEAPFGRQFPIEDTQLQWKLAGEPGDATLVVTDRQSEGHLAAMPVACSFCSGEGDNCSADGIYVLRQDDDDISPAIFAVCHKGAHSQKLSLIEPVGHGSEVLLEIVGDYYLNWEIKNGRLRVRPDGDASRQKTWPEE